MSERERMERAIEEPWVFPRDASVDELNSARNGYLAGLKRASEIAEDKVVELTAPEWDHGYALGACKTLRSIAAIIKELSDE